MMNVRFSPIIKVARSIWTWSSILICICGFLLQPAMSQRHYDPPCTFLKLRCPSYVVDGSAPITFSVEVVDARQILGEEGTNRLAYKWQISGGKIVGGQETSTITVNPTDAQAGVLSLVTVTVEVKGVNPECDNKKSCALKINPRCTPPNRVDQYCDISFADEKVHLDKLAKALINSGADSSLVIVAYAGKTACVGEAQWRADRAEKYLMEKHRITSDRIILVDGGYRENFSVELFLLPRNACGPFPTPTLFTSDAEVKGFCSDKYKEVGSP